MNMTILEPLTRKVPCVGPRGDVMNESDDEALRFGDLDTGTYIGEVPVEEA